MHQQCITGASQVHYWCISSMSQVHHGGIKGASQAHHRSITGASQVHCRYITGTSQVHYWCITGALLVHQGCITDASGVHHWCIRGALRACHWCNTGSSLTHRRSITGASGMASQMHPRCIPDALQVQSGVHCWWMSSASQVHQGCTIPQHGRVVLQGRRSSLVASSLCKRELQEPRPSLHCAGVLSSCHALCWRAVILSCTVLACCHLVMLSWGSWLPFGSRLCWRLMAPACDRCIGVHHRCIMVHHRRIVGHQVHQVHHWCIEGASPVHRRSMGALQVHHRCITSECPVNQWFQ